MALKEKKGRQQLRGTRAFRKRVLGERRRTGLVVLVGLVIVLAGVGVVVGLSSSSYLGASPIGSALKAGFLGGDEEGASMERVVNPVVAAEAPAPVSEEAATAERVADEESEGAAEEKEAAEAARLEAEQVAAAEEEAAAWEAGQIAAQEEQEEAAAQAALEAELAAQQPTLEEELPTEEGLPEDESAPVPPSDPTMYLSVPKLGISGAIVAGGEAGLELGAQLVSGAPWVQGSNTYIAGHRIGFPGTGSDRIFYDLPSMAAGDTVTLYDSLGQEYTYQVSEVFAVTPYDVWVTAPTGSDMVTLQVCTETPDDWTTIGPRLMSSGPESGRLIVRAVRV